MSKKTNEMSQILSQEKLASDVYSMWLRTEEIAKEASPGQFVSVYSRDGSRVLPRPISICEVSEDKRSLRLVYRVVGKGTEEFSMLKAGDQATPFLALWAMDFLWSVLPEKESSLWGAG